MSESSEDFQQVLNKAFFFLKFRLRTKKEMYDYLIKKFTPTHISSDTVKEVLQHLEETRFLDDKEFIRMFVESRTAHKPKSEFVMKQELQRYGVDKELVNEYFLDHPTDQSQQCLQALTSKWSRFKSLDKQKRFEKAASFLSRRGFSFDVIKKTIAEMEKEE